MDGQAPLSDLQSNSLISYAEHKHRLQRRQEQTFPLFQLIKQSSAQVLDLQRAWPLFFCVASNGIVWIIVGGCAEWHFFPKYTEVKFNLEENPSINEELAWKDK